jgi:hypothetical protein
VGIAALVVGLFAIFGRGRSRERPPRPEQHVAG